MSIVATETVSVQAEPVTTTETQPATPATSQPEATSAEALGGRTIPVKTDAEALAESKAERERLQQRATRLLARFTTVMRRGERLHAKTQLYSGALAAEYIATRLAVGDKRESAVKALEGKLSEISGTDNVRVNRLIATWAAWKILAKDRGLDSLDADKGAAKEAAHVPYAHYREHWARLVVRQDKATRDELWTLKPEVNAEEANKQFVHACTARLSGGAVSELVDGLLGVAPKGKAEDKPAATGAAPTPQTPGLPTTDGGNVEWAEEDDPTAKPESPARQKTLRDYAADTIKADASTKDVASLFLPFFEEARAAGKADALLADLLSALVTSGSLSRKATHAVQSALILLARTDKPAAPATPQTPALPTQDVQADAQPATAAA